MEPHKVMIATPGAEPDLRFHNLDPGEQILLNGLTLVRKWQTTLQVILSLLWWLLSRFGGEEAGLLRYLRVGRKVLSA